MISVDLPCTLGVWFPFSWLPYIYLPRRIVHVLHVEKLSLYQSRVELVRLLNGPFASRRRDLSPFGSLRSPSRALPTETKVESETSQSKSGTSVNLNDSGISFRHVTDRLKRKGHGGLLWRNRFYNNAFSNLQVEGADRNQRRIVWILSHQMYYWSLISFRRSNPPPNHQLVDHCY